ncbi:TetR/AcrR family transcriptional regulator [Companilactobacillus sp. FL22-1]|uniref:TetR/AcrR family transcriptional regulator n=1 Tax=Companilactobacillus sp. FL22-1 TaxID=3373892 RepID=UPI00375509B4
MKKVDRRVQKTNQALQKAFQELAQGQNYHDITVKALTEKAQINRKTFYLHYDSIDDFADMVAHEIAQRLFASIIETPLDQSLPVSGYIFDRFFDFFEKSRQFYTFLMTSNEYSFLARKVETEVSVQLAKEFNDKYEISRLDAYICANFICRNTLTLFRIYHQNSLDIDRSQFKNRLIRLNTTGITTFIAKKSVPKKFLEE